MDRYIRPGDLRTRARKPPLKFGVTGCVRFLAFLIKWKPMAKKLQSLRNYTPPNIYEYVAGCSMHTMAVTALEKIYIKPPSEIFASHLLTNCKQEPGQQFDQLFRKLKPLAKDCNFNTVSAEQNQTDTTYDAFLTK